MGRRRQHGEATANALLDEAERIVETEGLEALTVRRVAAGIDTTTRAVYTAFGSKDALLVALGARGFDLLRAGIEARPVTDDPAADLAEDGVAVFRRFMLEHPALFRIGVQRVLPDPDSPRASGTPPATRSPAWRHASSGSRPPACSATARCRTR